MRLSTSFVTALVSLSTLALASADSFPSIASTSSAALARLDEESGGAASVSLHRATGVARFVRLEPGALPLRGAGPTEKGADFLDRYGAAFGIADPAAELTGPVERTDRHGRSRLTYGQVYRGVPVFAGMLRAHFDAAGRMRAFNGTFVPGISIDPKPVLSPSEAGEVALSVVREKNEPPSLSARGTRLVVFRTGLLQGVPGQDRLAFEVEVSDGAGIREFVFVDAGSGKVVDRISGIQETLTRTVHQPAFNNVVIWNEGQSLPYSTGDSLNDGQVNGLIRHSSDVYDLYSRLSGGTFLSWDGASATMHTVWKSSSVSCPNANWNGATTNFCDGVASDDVIAHEWTHAYTQSTHGLIYQWQSGALNEAYSDMFGEVVDLLDGAGTDLPNSTRLQNDCSTVGGTPPPGLVVQAPPPIARPFSAAGAAFNPSPPKTASGAVQLVNDGDNQGGTASVTDACQALIGFTPGRIALVDRGTCGFTTKVVNAQNAGAVAVIVANTDNGLLTMSGSNPAITIPSVLIARSDADLVKAQLAAGVSATISLTAASTTSVRWLVSEDAWAFGGPIRDMWSPTCFADPGKVSDRQYVCSTSDGGGVHTNSGVPNHAFALLVDGGTFNGRTVPAIGLTKTAHVYWRAMETYQVPATDFADHADALSQSCSDLVGVNLASLTTGAPSGEVITLADCSAVDEAMLAVEMRSAPPCSFAPLLNAGPAPSVCENVVFSAGFETDPAPTWTRSNAGVNPEYIPRDWAWTSALPGGRSGHALFALDSLTLGGCSPGDDQSGVMSLESPPIPLSGASSLTFDHYVATEPLFDGGNVKIAVNGGPYQTVTSGSFVFNPYNTTLSGTGNTNPMVGQPAWSGADGGQVRGSWGQSQASLAAYAGPSDTVRIRFDFGVDGCNGLDGWYVDDVKVCTLVPAAGRVPDNARVPGTPLTLGKAGGGTLAMSWGGSCLAADTDYEVYEGTIGGTFTSHVPRLCTTGGATVASLVPGPSAAYYLIVPRNASREGSYGSGSSGSPRPASAAACLIQAAAARCP